MTEPTPPSGDPARPERTAQDPARVPRWLPAAAVTIGVLALALTVRPAAGLDLGFGDGPGQGFRPVFAVAAFAVLVWLAASFAKHRDDGFGLLHRAGTACAILLGVAAIAVPFGLLFLGRKPPAPVKPPPPPLQDTSTTTGASTTRTPTPTPKPHHADTAGWIGAIAEVLALAIVAAIVVCVILVILNVLRRGRIVWSPNQLAEFGLLGDADELADAVEAAAQALDDGGDTREAVIACYAAMEQSVRAAGVGRNSADTPEDLLRRATAAGLIPGDAGTRLTDLFREARFSRHPMTDAHRADAREALAEISAHLQAVRPAASAGAAS